MSGGSTGGHPLRHPGRGGRHRDPVAVLGLVAVAGRAGVEAVARAPPAPRAGRWASVADSISRASGSMRLTSMTARRRRGCPGGTGPRSRRGLPLSAATPSASMNGGSDGGPSAWPADVGEPAHGLGQRPESRTITDRSARPRSPKRARRRGRDGGRGYRPAVRPHRARALVLLREDEHVRASQQLMQDHLPLRLGAGPA